MRTVDLAIFADVLAARSADASARLERARARVRQVAIEREARLELAPQTVRRLEAAGVLVAADLAAARAEVAALAADVRALEELQAWVEQRLFVAREEGLAVHE